jgi:lipid-A-disaccharide synthase
VLLLPGSRSQEVRYLLPPLLRAAEILGAEYQFVVAVAPTLAVTDIEAVVNQAAVQIQVVSGDTYNLIHAADLALVASGTATLETALLGRPMVIVYRMAPLTYTLARLLVRVPFIGMPNLIAGRKVVPELVQGEVTGEHIAAEAKRILDTPAVQEEMIAGLSEVRRQLGGGGAAIRAAAIALQMLEEVSVQQSEVSCRPGT